MKRPTSRRIEWIPTVFFAFLGGLCFYLAATSLAEQGAASGTAITNAAMYPRLIAGMLLGLLVMQLISGFRNPVGKDDSAEPDAIAGKQTRQQILLSSCLFITYLVLLPIVGYLLMTSALVIGLLYIFGLRNIVKVVSFAVVLTLACAIVFEGIFNVNLPRGIFGLAFSF